MPKKQKQKQQEELEIKRINTFSLTLTKFELIHLRDLFGIVLPPDMKTTVSQSLAISQERSLIETKLWQKIAALCKTAQVPTDHEAPDFIVSPIAPPPMGVFQLAHEPDQPPVRVEKEDSKNMFEKNEE
jgi:hypothetical protein